MLAREQKDDKLVLEDFEYDGDGPDAAFLDSLFDDIIGCKSVKEKMSELTSTVLFPQAQGKEAAASGVGYAYLFLGNPDAFGRWRRVLFGFVLSSGVRIAFSKS